MPPTRGGRGRRGNANTRGRPYANPRQSPAKIPHPKSQWPHLTKEKKDRQPLVAQSGCGYLSLQIRSLGTYIADKGWPLLSHRASTYSPQQAAEEAARLVKEKQQEAERQAQLFRDKLEQQQRREQNVAFITLRYSIDTWERSELPFVQLERARRVQNIEPAPRQETQTLDVKPLVVQDSISLPPLSFNSNGLESVQGPVTRYNSLTNLSDAQNPGLTDQYTSEASDSAPITPVHSNAQQKVVPFASEARTNIQDNSQNPEVEYSQTHCPYTMSGKSSIDAGGIDESIKDVIQNLFVMQQHVASFRPEIQDGLNRKVDDLAVSLQKLDDLVAQPTNPIHSIKIAPDIIDYVDDGRNPDIYTRDFVELVQRGNAVLNGKQRAFRNFSKIFAKSLKDNFEGMDEEVDSIMENAGMEEKGGSFVEKQQNGNAA